MLARVAFLAKRSAALDQVELQVRVSCISLITLSTLPSIETALSALLT